VSAFPPPDPSFSRREHDQRTALHTSQGESTTLTVHVACITETPNAYKILL